MINNLKLISVRENPEYQTAAIAYFQAKWANPQTEIIYEDCITHSIDSKSSLPQWYLLLNEAQEIIGGAGLISNDFISRMDLWPWLCALYIEPTYRGHQLGSLLLKRAQTDSKQAGFDQLYLATDHIGFYEKYGFSYLGEGYHPWGESSRIYQISLK
ncbi:MAG: GNAT family N-acetyltransferase [Candidatus Cloacimonadales bacterium]